MTIADLIVGTVAVVLGVLMLLAAALNWQWCYNVPKAQRMERWWGRGPVRGIYGFIGLMLIALGVAIWAGLTR